MAREAMIWPNARRGTTSGAWHRTGRSTPEPPGSSCPVGRTVRLLLFAAITAGRWRRWTGIEPAKQRDSVSPVLKTVAPTRNAYTSMPAVLVPNGNHINLVDQSIRCRGHIHQVTTVARVGASTDHNDPADELLGERTRRVMGKTFSTAGLRTRRAFTSPPTSRRTRGRFCGPGRRVRPCRSLAGAG